MQRRKFIYLALFAIFLLVLAYDYMAVSSDNPFEEPASALFNEVKNNASLCSRGKDIATRTDCYIKAAPDKCEQEARKFLATNMNSRELFICVSSCVNAGFASRVLGECSRSLSNRNAGLELKEIIAQEQRDKFEYYWRLVVEAEQAAMEKYPYLKKQHTDADSKALKNYIFLKDNYLSANAPPHDAVWRAANETNKWWAAQPKAAPQPTSRPYTEPSAPSPPTTRTHKDAYPNCVIYPVMTDADFIACGRTPPDNQ